MGGIASTAIVGLIVLVCVMIAVKSIIKKKKAGGCCGGCAGCSNICTGRNMDDVK